MAKKKVLKVVVPEPEVIPEVKPERKRVGKFDFLLPIERPDEEIPRTRPEKKYIRIKSVGEKEQLISISKKIEAGLARFVYYGVDSNINYFYYEEF